MEDLRYIVKNKMLKLIFVLILTFLYVPETPLNCL